MESNFNNGVFGDKVSHWTGRVADDSAWQTNAVDTNRPDPEKPGWGQRVKVRIFGRDPADKEILPDQHLKMATISNSPNAGSGAGGAVMSHQIKQGDLVFGIYLDQEQQQPVITGVLAHSSQTQLEAGDPEEGFTARSDYKGVSGDKTVSRKDQVSGTGQPREQNDDPNQTGASNDDEALDKAKKTPIKSKCDKDNTDAKTIKVVMDNLMLMTSYAKAAQKNSQNNQGYSLASAPDFISAETNKSAKLIAGVLKDTLAKARGTAVSELNAQLEKATPLLFPNQREDLKKATEQGTDGLACAFNKIIGGLVDLVEGLLTDLVNQYVVAPICAVEDFLSSIIDNIVGQISGALESIFGTFQSLFGESPIQSGLDFISGAFDIIAAVVQFFTCDEEENCPGYDGWSFGSGSVEGGGFSQGLGKKLKGIVGEGGPLGECPVLPVPCGPPSISFSGGGGSGAAGNPVVNAAGAILGIDITNPGSGYNSPPTITISDACGSGAGAVAKALVGPLDGLIDPDADGNSSAVTSGAAGYTPPQGVTQVQMLNSGYNYLPSPNGSSGGAGVEVLNPGDAMYITPLIPSSSNVPGGATGAGTGTGGTGTGGSGAGTGTGGSGYTGLGANSGGSIEYFDSGETFPVQEGGQIGLGVGVEGSIYDDNGDLVQTIIGQGFSNPVEVDYNLSGQKYDLYEYTGDNPDDPNSGAPPNIDPNWIFISDDFEDANIPTWNQKLEYYPGSVVKYNGSPSTGYFTVPGALDSETTTVIDSSSELTSGNKYAVVLSLQDVLIIDPGYGYQSDDNIFIAPSNGAKLSVEYDKFGKVSKVNILDPGLGFTDIPEIGIISNTGYNARFRPVFKVIRLSDEDFETLPPGTEIISVVDCVGKF
tara:strand:+ start:2296 stop:4926 length:2631 start_codon:yes stop_codon:yes gene_type:complete